MSSLICRRYLSIHRRRPIVLGYGLGYGSLKGAALVTVIPPAKQSTDSTEGKPGRRWPRWLVAVGAILLVVLAIAVGVAVWASQQLSRIQQVSSRTREQYAALNRQYPYRTPAAGKASPAERFESMLKVRQSLAAGLTPEIKDSVDSLLRNPTRRRVAQLLANSKALLPAIESAVQSHQQALQAEAMSFEEYRWLLGALMHEAIQDPQRYQAGAQYRSIMERLEQATRGESEFRVGTDRLTGLLDKQYKNQPPAASALVDRLAEGGEELYWLDLLAVTSSEVKASDLTKLPGLHK